MGMIIFEDKIRKLGNWATFRKLLLYAFLINVIHLCLLIFHYTDAQIG